MGKNKEKYFIFKLISEFDLTRHSWRWLLFVDNKISDTLNESDATS